MELLGVEQGLIQVRVIMALEVLDLKRQEEEQIILHEVIVIQIEEIIAALVVQEITTREAIHLGTIILEADRAAVEVITDHLLLREVAVALHHLHQEVHLGREPHLQEVVLQEAVVHEVAVVQDVQIEDKN